MYKLFMYCNKMCFRSLCCPLSVQNYHNLKRIHANIVQNPTFLGRFQTFGGQCTCIHTCVHIYIYIYIVFCLFVLHGQYKWILFIFWECVILLYLVVLGIKKKIFKIENS